MTRHLLSFAISAVVVLASFKTQVIAGQKSVCDTPERHQFDFALGEWNVVDKSGQVDGTNSITSEYGGCVIVEHWKGVDGDDGSSFNAYMPNIKQWAQTWVDNQGRMLRWAGSLQDGSMVLSLSNVNHKGLTMLDRLVWTPLPDGRVRQHLEESADSGLHWREIFDGYYTRKK